MEEGKTTVKGYFPQGKWYDYYDGKLIHDKEFNGEWYDLNSPIYHIPLHVRGGYILPTQDEANTTEYSRKNPFGIIIAPNHDGEAIGDLFYDDGKSELNQNKYYFATFLLRNNILKMNVEHNTYSDMNSKILNTIRIFTKGSENVKFILNGQLLSGNKIVLRDNEIILTDLNLSMNKEFELKWQTDKILPNVLVDCSIQNNSISKQECENKKCEFNQESPLPCYIPKTVGGYFLVSECDEEYELERYNDLKLYEKPIEKVTIKVTHAKIKNTESHLTRIEVFLSILR